MVPAVHVMSGDLILHKRTLEPIKTLVYGLRRYDLDRCTALIDSSQVDPVTGAPPRVEGYMSRKAIVYLVCISATCASYRAGLMIEKLGGRS